MPFNASPQHFVVKKFMHTDRLHRRVVDKYIGALGLHRSQHMLLMYLSHTNGNTKQKEIAEHMQISPTAITVKMKKLEKEGFITRITDRDDSRVNTVKITEKGKKIVEQSERIFNAIDEKMLNGISKEQAASFVDCLDTICKNLIELDNLKKTQDNRRKDNEQI